MSNEKEPFNFLNIGGLIGAIALVGIIYLILPHAKMSNFVYILVLIVGWVIGSVAYHFIRELF